MGKALNKLIEISGSPLGEPGKLSIYWDAMTYQKGCEKVFEMLALKNGFYAFESALHVFPVAPFPGVMGLEKWNSFHTWRAGYDDMAVELFFFAEDLFGMQFCVSESGICSFDSETGACTVIASTMEEWAALLLDDYNFHTGYQFAREWQEKYGPLKEGYRLIPEVPFVLGGEYAIANLGEMESIEAMLRYGYIARKIRNTPDGAQVEVRFT